MKRTKELKTNKGITLIALIITVIIMLILAGVTIDTVVNNDLFGYARKAVEDTEDALDYEQQLVNEMIDELITPNTSNTPKGITAATMKSNLATYLGQPVNYGVTYTDASTYGNGEWEIFYADGEHIYLITKGYLVTGAITITGYNGTSDFTAGNLQSKYKAVAAGLLNKTYDPTSVGSELKYTSTNSNMKATQYLLDSIVWASYANNEYAEWAIGAPTFELFVNSFNAYYPDNAVTLETPTGNGYANPLLASDSVPSGTYLNHSTGVLYWLACPASYGDTYVQAVRGNNANVNCGGYTGTAGYNFVCAFRPVVCLDSDVQITWDSTNSEYTLSRAS